MTPLELAVVVVATGSVFFSLVAAVGIVRLPDVYSRTHATSKSDTMGTGLALIAAALALDSGTALLKIVLLLVFVLLTNPVAAHAISRAAYLEGVPPASREESGTTEESDATDLEGDR